MRYLRAVTGKTKHDQKRNTKIRLTLDSQPLLQMIKVVRTHPASRKPTDGQTWCTSPNSLRLTVEEDPTRKVRKHVTLQLQLNI